MELETWKTNNSGKLPYYGTISNIVASKAATLAWLTNAMVLYHLPKLNQAGKATNSLVQLPTTSYDTKWFSQWPDSPHQFLPWWQIQVSISNSRNARDLLTQKERHLATFTVEKDGMVHLVLKAWDESFAHNCHKPKSCCWTRLGPLNYKLLLHLEIQLTSNSILPYLQHQLVFPWHTRHPEVDWQAFLSHHVYSSY